MPVGPIYRKIKERNRGKIGLLGPELRMKLETILGKISLL